MNTHPQVKVAVLLATFNGARYVTEQIESLRNNTTPFVLHWLDDHSSDGTRDVVRAAVQRAGIELCEWHQPRHLGFPGTFLELFDRVDADIYMYCDQDDIWQPGKIDAVAANVGADAAKPVLCYSDPLIFYEHEPQVFYRLTDVGHTKALAESLPTRVFLSCPAAGQATAVTRGLRELYLRHRDIARAHAIGQTWWLHILAVIAGEVRPMLDAPTTLYRQHGDNVTSAFYARNRPIIAHSISMWRLHQVLRIGFARQARGFLLAKDLLPQGPELKRLLELASLVATIDRRQSPLALARLLFRRAMWPYWAYQFWLTLTCLFTDAQRSVAASPASKESRIIPSRA